MTFLPARRSARWTVALTTLLCAAVLLPAGPVGAAGTADSREDVVASLPVVVPDDDRAVVTLTDITPTILHGAGTVTVAGTVTAPASGPLDGARVDVVLGSASLTHRADIDTWATATGPATGRVVATRTLPDVQAGATVGFTVTFDESAVATGAAFAALPIAVEVMQRGATRPTGVNRTFLAWNSRVEFEPLDIAVAMPVTLDPDPALHANATDARAAAWTSAIGPGSRIDRILEGTRGHEVTLAVDPTVLGASPVVASGSAGTAGPTPSTSPSSEPSGTPTSSGNTPGGTDGSTGGGSDAVGRLQDHVIETLQGRSLWALPYADADVAATVGLDPANPLIHDLVTRASAVGDLLHAPVRDDIAWPVDGLLPGTRDRRIQQAWSGTSTGRAAGILVDQRAITADSSYTPTARRISSGGVRLLGYDARLSALLPKRSDTSPTQSLRRFLAESLVLLGERPGTPRSVLLAAPRTYDPDPASLTAFLASIQDAAWLHPVDAATLLKDRDGEKTLAQEKPTKAPPSAAPKAVLNRARLAQLATQRETLLRVAAVLRDGVAFEQTYRELLDELASVRWRYRRAAWTTLNNRVTSDTRAATSAIRVKSRRVNFLAENGTLRITIENGLDYAVENLRVVVTPTNPRLQVLEQPGPLSIAAGPGSLVNVNVPVRAVAAGRADLSVYLTTADGTPIGSPAIIPVSANPLDSTIYWIGGVLVGLVLIAGVIRTVRKGTSRIDEIGDLEVVAERDEAAEDRKRD